MLAENLIDIAKIALEYVLLAIFFLCVIDFVHIKDQYAETLNREYDLQVTTRQQLEFGKYNTGLNQWEPKECLNADAVMEAIRLYRDAGICIYVDRMGRDSDTRYDYLLDGTTLEEYQRNGWLSVAYLKKMLDLEHASYHPYVVYDNDDMRGPYRSTGTEVKGLAFIRR